MLEEKLEKLKIQKKKLMALALAGVIASTGSGCARNTGSLDGSTLANTKVITTTDGKIEIVRDIYKSSNDRYCKLYNDNTHHHYRDVISGNYYSDSESCEKYEHNFRDIFPIVLDVASVESITDYLTPEEIAKSANGQLTEDDITNIILRIKTQSIEVESELQK